MGLVVQFGPPAVRPRRQRPERPCEITIFPGVRYERHGEAYDAMRRPDDRRPVHGAPLGSEQA